MTKAEMKAMEIIKGFSTKKLLELWETTTDSNDKNIPTVRGWIMDEIETRFPEAYERWLDGDAEDSTLKNYILA